MRSKLHPQTEQHETTFAHTVMNVPAKPKQSMAGPGWRPDHFEVECAAKECPVQVGLLIFAAQPTPEGKIPFVTCTAFLSAADVITSNGHCDLFATRKGYFITQRVKGQKLVREISGVMYKKLSSLEADNNPRPDVAMFKLSEPVTNMPALAFASGPQEDFKKLTAFSIFEGKQPNLYRVESRECLIKRHQARFPFTIREAPDVFRAFNCEMIEGNSGSPMFAPGNPAVQAVLFGGDKLPAKLDGLRADEKVRGALSTNVRCLDYPGAKPIACVVNDINETNRRWAVAQQFEFDKLRQREFPASAGLGVKFKGILMQMKSDNFDLEIAYLPSCRLSPAPLTSVPVFVEKLKLVTDDWADFTHESQSVTPAAATIKANVGDGYQINVTWPAPSAELARPEQDIRRQFGNSFRIDIPVCPK